MPIGSDTEIVVQLTAETAQLQAGMDAGAASVKQSTDAMRATVADEAAAFNAAVQSKIDAQLRLNTAFAGGITSTAGIAEAEAALDQAMAAGAVTAAEYSGYIDTLSASEAVLAGATEADTVAIVENTGAKVLNARVSGELGTMLGEVLSGNFGRLRRSAGALANQSGLLAKAFTGMGPPILAAAGAVIAFGVAIVKGAEEQAKFNGALLMTGGSTGVLSGDLQDMTERVGEASGSFGNAKEAMLAVVQSGRIAGDEMQAVGIAAQQMAALTGESVQKSVDAFVKLQEKPVQAVAALNDKYHFLTTAIFDQIAALQKQGDTEDAAKLATEAYAKALQDRSTQVQGSLGLLARSWDSVKSSASFAWDAMLNVGKESTLQDKIGNAQTALEHFQKMGLVDFNVKAGHVGWETTSKGKNDSGAQYEIDNLKKLQAQLADQQQAATKQSGSDAAVTKHADAVAKVIDKHHALTKAITESGAAERKAAQEATNALEMQRIGTQTNTAERIQADAAVLASATKLYGADSSQQATALRQMLADEKSYDASVVKARKDALAAQEKEEKDHAIKIKKAYDDAYAAAAKSWHLYLDPINHAFQQSINGMIQGTQTLRQMTANILQSITASYLQEGLKQLEKHIINQQAMVAATAKAAEERAAIEAGAAVKSKAIDAATGKSQITSAAATGAAKAYQAIVGIPYVGPILAPIAAGVAFAGIEAFSGMISSAAGGWERVPMDGMMTELHKDEMVLPAHVANPIRQMAAGGGQGGGMTVNLSSTDPRGFQEYLRRNPAALSNALKHAHKRGHFAGAMR